MGIAFALLIGSRDSCQKRSATAEMAAHWDDGMAVRYANCNAVQSHNACPWLMDSSSLGAV